MMRVRTRMRRVPIMATLLLGLVGAGFGSAPAHAAAAQLTGLRVAGVATQGMALAWNPIGDHGYRVRMATSSSMSGSRAGGTPQPDGHLHWHP